MKKMIQKVLDFFSLIVGLMVVLILGFIAFLAVMAILGIFLKAFDFIISSLNIQQ